MNKYKAYFAVYAAVFFSIFIISVSFVLSYPCNPLLGNSTINVTPVNFSQQGWGDAYDVNDTVEGTNTTAYFDAVHDVGDRSASLDLYLNDSYNITHVLVWGASDGSGDCWEHNLSVYVNDTKIYEYWYDGGQVGDCTQEYHFNTSENVTATVGSHIRFLIHNWSDPIGHAAWWVDEIGVFGESVSGGGGAPPAGGSNDVDIKNPANNSFTYWTNASQLNLSVNTSLSSTCKFNDSAGFDYTTQGTTMQRSPNNLTHWYMLSADADIYSYYYKCQQDNGTQINSTLHRFYRKDLPWTDKLVSLSDSTISDQVVSWDDVVGVLVQDELTTYPYFSSFNWTYKNNAGDCISDVGGCAAKSLLARYKTDLIDLNPRYGFVSAGIDDENLDVPNADFAEDLRTLVSNMSQNMTNTTDLILTTISPTLHKSFGAGSAQEQIDQYNQIFREVAIEYRALLVEWHWIGNHDATELNADGYHVNEAGMRTLNRTMVDMLLNTSKYRYTPERFDYLSDCNNSNTVLNYTFYGPTMNCLNTTAADWLVLRNVSNGSIWIEQADKPFNLSIYWQAAATTNYTFTLVNGSTTTAVYESDADGNITEVEIGEGANMSLTWAASNPIEMNNARIGVLLDDRTLLGYCTGTHLSGNDITYYYRWYLNGTLYQNGYYENSSNGTSKTVLYDWSVSPAANMSDADFNTWAMTNNAAVKNGTVLINFSNYGVMQAEYKNNYTYANYSLNASCYGNPIQLKAVSYSGSIGGLYWNALYCKNASGTNWIEIRNDTNNSGVSRYARIYELKVHGVYNYTSGTEINRINLTYDPNPGDSWIFACMASDGSYNSTWYNSSNVTISETKPTIHYTYNITPGFYNGTNGLNTSVWCTSPDSATLIYNITLNNVSLFNGIVANGTNVSNISTPLDGLNQLYINCSTPTFIYNTTLTVNITVNSFIACFINERTGALYDVSQTQSAMVYYNENRTQFDFKANSTACVNFTSDNDDQLRFEYVLNQSGTMETITRFVNPSLLDNTNYIRVCANDVDVTQYEQYIISGTQKPAYIKNLYPNCTIGADYTRFAYQESYLLKVKTIDADYTIYTWDDGEKIALSNLDGSIESYTNLDFLIFNNEMGLVSLLSDSLTFEKVEGSDTMTIYYQNLRENNEELTVQIYRTDLSQLLYTNSELGPNNFTLYYDYSLLNNVSNQTIFMVQLTKTDASGTQTTLRRYFNINGGDGILNSVFAFVIALAFSFFGLTFASIRTTFSWFGIVIVLISIAILGAAISTWYITLLMAFNVIILLYIIMIMNMKNYPTVA